MNRTINPQWRFGSPPRFSTLEKATAFYEHFKTTGEFAWDLAEFPFVKDELGKSFFRKEYHEARYEFRLICNGEIVEIPRPETSDCCK
jgi:hypothetical protein